MTYSVRLEPIGVDMQVNDDETVLQAAFRQGITLMHGCKEGQCSSCKSVLLDGDAEHGDYSTFALSESEQSEGRVLLCRLYAQSDLEIELLNYDEDMLANWIPARTFQGTVKGIESLTRDIRRLDIELDTPMSFHAGQFAEITLPDAGVRRSYSMANPPQETATLSFIIKTYAGGKFSSRLADGLAVGDGVALEGPFGTSFRNQKHRGGTLLVGGGSGMAPLLSILCDLVAARCQDPVRFYYGARAERDLFYLERIAALGAQLADFAFIPALSEPAAGDAWDGERGLIHDVLARQFAEGGRNPRLEAYVCGPPPMVDAVLPVLQKIGVDADNIHLDKFTPAGN
ncbi:MAG: NADH:ubiquinone reductase (Na(+)-transporting) subunit F [Gammaproteobacteria bacterium]